MCAGEDVYVLVRECVLVSECVPAVEGAAGVCCVKL